MDCREIQNLLPLHACDELDGDTKVAVETHLANCTECRVTLEQEHHLVEAIQAADTSSEFEDSSSEAGQLLITCRASLADALDQQEGPRLWKRLIGKLSPAGWLAAQPALSAAMLVLMGVVVGQGVPHLFVGPEAPGSSGAPAMVVSGLKSAPSELNKYNVEGISLARAGQNTEASPMIEMQYRDDAPQVLRGTVDDPEVRLMLMKVVEDGHRFNAGLRLESVEALRTRCGEADVRQMLCRISRNDRNAAVRLKALEALRSFGEDPQVRDAMLAAVKLDQNPGVRVEAITALRAMTENGDALPLLANDKVFVAALRELMQKDPNTYVRLQSAAAMQKINSREVH
ncbi:MAG: HEAT repeat domain-containing protein [Acidobacteria bacterium]|nr:HEAT repeat domain-containing protein [Acidobacteriota bacterium]